MSWVRPGVTVINRPRSTMIRTLSSDIRSSLLKFVGGRIDLIVDKTLGIATICLNHPERANAFTGKMMVELNDAVDVLTQDTGLKAVLVYGAHKTFCSGADLTFVNQNLAPSLGLRMSQWMQQVTLKLQRLPLVTVALLHGPALGGGAELAVACDLRIVTPAGRLQFVHGRMGIVPGWGGGTRLVQLVGPSRALEMMCRGHSLGPHELLASGLATTELPSSLDPSLEALTWVQELVAAAAPRTIQALKTVVKNAEEFSVEKSLEAERVQFGKVWGGPIHREALDRVEKKKKS